MNYNKHQRKSYIGQEDCSIIWRIIMNMLDIIGPVMVGPSSSHTAGAVKIGYISGK